MLLDELAETSEAVATTSSRLGKIDRLASMLGRAAPEEVPIAVAYLSGEIPQGSVGVGWAALRDLPPATAPGSTLTLTEVDAAMARIASAAGRGSQSARRNELRKLFARATPRERAFLLGLFAGEIRQGALAGIMVEAVARAASVPAATLRRAAMLAGDLGVVAAAALAHGSEGLATFGLTILRPIQPMLAQTADDIEDALARIASPAVEWKLDGARIQVHRQDGVVRAFTRNLADITDRVPEVVAATLALPARQLVLDGEAIALRRDGRPHPFQVTMSRFGSRLDIEEQRRQVPLSPFLFDLLHLDGKDLLDRPAAERFAFLDRVVPEERRVPRLMGPGPDEARRFLDDALAHGHEGVMVKAMDAPYEAGRRGASWLKVKRAHTLDLMVLAAEWGHGRRRGWLSNLHLGARDTATGGFVMLGKTFKGMTDRMLTWQTERLLELETSRDEYTVWVRPELVVEVAFDGIQSSPRYPAGLALRFARIKGYRHDKGPEDVDTIDTVRAIHSGTHSDRP